MNVFVVGFNGYIGWPLVQYLTSVGDHVVGGMDSDRKAYWTERVGSRSVTPVRPWDERAHALAAAELLCLSSTTEFRETLIALRDFSELAGGIDAVVHLGHQPSAPYSMRGRVEAADTAFHNVVGTLNLLWAVREVCPDAHFVTIGSMGEYGTPRAPILEPPFEAKVRDLSRPPHEESEWFIPQHYPRCASSFYHSTKVASTHDLERACAWWGLRATDIMQGPVYGVRFPGSMEGEVGLTSFWPDSDFGTALNRFCAQALIGHPLTVYGAGTQQRGFLPLADSLCCLGIVLDNPPEASVYRCINQLAAVYSILDLAKLVQTVAKELGLAVEIAHLDNPRHEAEAHFYEPQVRWLAEHGYVPTTTIADEVRKVMTTLLPYRDRAEAVRQAIAPAVTWR